MTDSALACYRVVKLAHDALLKPLMADIDEKVGFHRSVAAQCDLRLWLGTGLLPALFLIGVNLRSNSLCCYARAAAGSCLCLSLASVRRFWVVAARRNSSLASTGISAGSHSLLGIERCLLASASIKLASTAKPSLPTNPSSMHRCAVVSNTRRKRSLSRKRPWRFFENVD